MADPRIIFPGPRQPLHHFAGRHVEMARLIETLRGVATRARGAHRAGFTLITGTPGVGKTELSARFVAKATSLALGGAAPKAVSLKASELSNPLDSFLRIADAAGAGEAGRATAEMDTSIASGSASLSVAEASMTRDRKRVAHGFAAMMGALARAWPKGCPALIVSIDELQNATAESAAVLQSLHEGTEGCPVMPLGAGLQHTLAVLSGLGVSRVAPPITLGPLDAHDTHEAIGENLAYYGLEDVDDGPLSALADASFGYPAHIHGYLEAAVKAARQAGPHCLDDPRVLRNVIRDGHGARVEYYEGRLDAMHLDGGLEPREALMPLTAHFAKAGDRAIPQELAMSLCDRKPYDGQQTIQQAIAHGVLAAKDGMVSFGIPSFRAHMIGRMREWERSVSAAKEPPLSG